MFIRMENKYALYSLSDYYLIIFILLIFEDGLEWLRNCNQNIYFNFFILSFNTDPAARFQNTGAF